MKLAAIQLNSQDSVAENLAQILGQMSHAIKEHQPDLIALPEYALCLTSDDSSARASAQVIGDSAALAQLGDFARQNEIFVHLGSVVERTEDGRHFNTSVVFDRSGDIVSTYRKKNLFQNDLEEWSHSVVHNEVRLLSPGEDIETFKADDVTFGNSICYDLRFPELYQRLKAEGSEIVFAPAAFTQLTGRRDWEKLIRARASENGCYVVAANQCGTFDGGKYTSWGHTMIAGPTGEIIAECDREPGMIAVEINLPADALTHSDSAS